MIKVNVKLGPRVRKRCVCNVSHVVRIRSLSMLESRNTKPKYDAIYGITTADKVKQKMSPYCKPEAALHLQPCLQTHIEDAEAFTTLGKLNPTSPSRHICSRENIRTFNSQASSSSPASHCPS